MKTESQHIRNLIDLDEYKQSDMIPEPDEFDYEPNLSAGQKSLVKGMYTSDYFSVENVTARLYDSLR